jgi:hypothetical protein
MKDCKFKQLILDTYKDCKERTYTKEQFGITTTYGNYFGILYNPISTDSFNDIIDIDKYMDLVNLDMMYLCSRITNEEIEIYSWDLEDYEIKDDTLIIKWNNGRDDKLFKL